MFLIGLSLKFTYTMQNLFLSSKAGVNELVKSVAEIAMYGC